MTPRRAARHPRRRPSTLWRCGSLRRRLQHFRPELLSAAQGRWHLPLKTSSPTQLLDAVLVKAEVVGDLMHHGDPNLLLELLGCEIPLQRSLEDRDLVRQEPGILGPP